jgi:DNA mismatch repair protein MutL
MQEHILVTTGDNSSLIKVLPPEVSNKIAAGEVVQRPASVVKELLDNAIDAGATHISVVLQNAGRTLIQVRDNGCGMSEQDLALCFLRHATSKLSSVDDLQNIRTLGFRGEAMASIASVSQITVTTKRVEDEAGVEYEIRGGEEIGFRPAASDNGTSVTVRNLFYNVPARRAFLKTDATEFRHILLAFHQAALAWPEIGLDMDADGEIVYRLAPTDLESRIAELFGKSYRASLIPLAESTSMVNIQGLLSDPKLAKKTRGEQFLFMNRRPFYHRHLNYVIQEIFRDFLQPNEYPFFALFYEVNPESVDVNVHPTKQEIKFEDERMISTFTRSVVKKALNEHMRVPAWDPAMSDIPRSDVARQDRLRRSFEGGEPFSPESRAYSHGSFQKTRQHVPIDAASRLYEDSGDAHRRQGRGEGAEGTDARASGEHIEGRDYKNDAFLSERDSLDPIRRGLGSRENRFSQIHNQFIISQTRNGMLIMDQHAAHKRIIYEKVLGEAESGLPSTQQLLFPKTINFSATDFSLLKELHPVITRMGFNVQFLSGNSAMILGVPSDIRLDNEQHVLESIMEQYKMMSRSLSLDEKERIALAIANKAAIPRGKRLSEEEMEALVDQLFACDDPFRDPLGKRTIRSLTIDEIRSMFA